MRVLFPTETSISLKLFPWGFELENRCMDLNTITQHHIPKLTSEVTFLSKRENLIKGVITLLSTSMVCYIRAIIDLQSTLRCWLIRFSTVLTSSVYNNVRLDKVCANRGLLGMASGKVD